MALSIYSRFCVFYEVLKLSFKFFCLLPYDEMEIIIWLII